jgi:hypothetical protein
VQELNEIRLIIGVAHKPVKGAIIIVLDYRNTINFIVYGTMGGGSSGNTLRVCALIKNHDPVRL